MWRQDDPVEAAKRGVGRQGLDREHIERGAANPLLLDRLGERDFVDQLAPRGVDQDRGRLHEFQTVGVDQMMRLVGQRDVQCHDVRRAQERVDREQPHVQLSGALGQQIRIVADDLHAEGSRHLRDVAADAPQSHDAHRLATQLRALEFLAVPLAGSHRRRGVGNPPHQR